MVASFDEKIEKENKTEKIENEPKVIKKKKRKEYVLERNQQNKSYLLRLENKL